MVIFSAKEMAIIRSEYVIACNSPWFAYCVMGCDLVFILVGFAGIPYFLSISVWISVIIFVEPVKGLFSQECHLFFALAMSLL